MMPYSGAPSTLVDLSNNLPEIIAQAGRAVVTVYARSRLSTSGIYWCSGLAVTANHAVERDDQLYLTLPEGRTVEATLVGRDPTTDVAVLRLEDSEPDLPEVQHADPEHVIVGHLVLALGRSGETGLGASFGMISAVGESWRTRRGGQIDRLIRPDLRLYRGFVGGPLIDVQGRVIGMNTPVLSRRSDLTIPASTIDRVVDLLVKGGTISRGYLGVGMQPVQLPSELCQSLGIEQESGVMIMSVDAEGPALRAGVLLGDILIRFGEEPVRETYDLLELLNRDRIGKAVAAQVVRAGQLTELQITVAERPHRE